MEYANVCLVKVVRRGSINLNVCMYVCMYVHTYNRHISNPCNPPTLLAQPSAQTLPPSIPLSLDRQSVVALHAMCQNVQSCTFPFSVIARLLPFGTITQGDSPFRGLSLRPNRTVRGV